jgi:hypothetical protein
MHNLRELTNVDKDQAVKRVCEELVSPMVVGEELGGVSAANIRKWIKEAGKSLPTKYKIKGRDPKGPQQET